MVELMTEREAARRLAISTRTLQRLRTSGDGPVFIKIPAKGQNSRIAYESAALAAWVATRRRRSTSDTGASEAV